MKQYFCGITKLLEWNLQAVVSTELVEIKFNLEDISILGCLDVETGDDKEFKYSTLIMGPKKETYPITKDLTDYWFNGSVTVQKACKEPCCPENSGNGETNGAAMLTSLHASKKLTYTNSSPQDKGQPALAGKVITGVAGNATQGYFPRSETVYGGDFGKSCRDLVAKNINPIEGKYITDALNDIFKYALNEDGLLQENVAGLEELLNNRVEALMNATYNNLNCIEANQFCENCQQNDISKALQGDPNYVPPIIRNVLNDVSYNKNRFIKIVKGDNKPDLMSKFIKNKQLSNLMG